LRVPTIRSVCRTSRCSARSAPELEHRGLHLLPAQPGEW
jgi:hypothetical protein